MAITVIGGLTVATLLTLVVIPCLYRAMSGGRREEAPAPVLTGLDAAEEAGS
jgi:Cu/Ag efflux pump CusA